MQLVNFNGLYLAGLFIIFSTAPYPAHRERSTRIFQTGWYAMYGLSFPEFSCTEFIWPHVSCPGFTMRGTQPLIEGEDLSLPSNLNTAVITKIRYQLKDDDDDNRGEIQWPDEAALLIGGRVAETSAS